MRKFNFLFAILIISCGHKIVPTEGLSNYKDAIGIILELEKSAESRIQVSKELISFDLLAFHFQKYLLKDEIEQLNFNFYDVKDVVEENIQLESLSSKLDSNVRLFFSEEKFNYFFAELFTDDNPKTSYEERPGFNYSHIYMFKIEGNSVKLVKSSTLNYD